MNEITLMLPYPPSVNHYKRIGRTITTKRGKIIQQRFNSPETQRFFHETWFRIQREGIKSFADAIISLEVDLFAPDNRKRDIDNPIKILLDALQKGGIFANDYQIARLLIVRKEVIKGGQVIVRLKQI